MKSTATATPSSDPGLKPETARMRWTILIAFIVFAAMASIYVGAGEAATSPTLGETDLYSVLAGTTVTNTGETTTTGAVGVSPGTAITGFPPGVAGGGLHENDASAIEAQADNLLVFDELDQPCDQSFGAVDLTTTFPAGVEPGVYCSTSSFTLSGNLTLTGSGVWIFKTVSTLITSPGSSVTGGDPCDVWWRVGSSATLDTTTAFTGNIFALTSITMNNGATLDGRALAQNGQVALDTNTITSPSCSVASTSTPTSTSTSVATNTPVPSSTETTAATATQAALATATQAALATATTQAAVPVSTATPTAPAGILPPQTGDAGLLQSPRSLRPAGVSALAALSFLGVLALVELRRRRGQTHRIQRARHIGNLSGFGVSKRYG